MADDLEQDAAPVARPTTAAMVLDLLAAHGVEVVFGLPGVHNLAFWDALAPAGAGLERPQIIGVRHEQAAAYAADGLARASGGLGVALTTTGPGAANALAAFGEAAAAGSPVLVIASEVSTKLRRPGTVRGILHESRDQAALFEPLAKAVYRPSTPLAAVEAVSRAIVTALTSPRGAVYVGIPSDVLGGEGPEVAPPRGFPAEGEGPSAPDVDAALALIAGARRPLVWVGGGAVQSEAAEQVTALAARLGAPVVPTYAARGLLGPGHPLLVDAPPHEPEVADLVASADLLIALGTGFDGMATRNWSMEVPPKLLSVNLDPDHVSLNYEPDVAITADVGRTCDSLALRLRAREPWADSVFLLGGSIRRRLGDDPRTSSAVELLASVGLRLAARRADHLRHGGRGLLGRWVRHHRPAAAAAVPRGVGHARLRAPCLGRRGRGVVPARARPHAGRLR